jgi:sugar phosphate isomerase/epimerase
MKIGIIVLEDQLGEVDFLKVACTYRSLGFEGLSFRSPFQLSSALDLCQLRDIRQAAEEIGMFVSFDLGFLNPYNAVLSPELWAIGAGDYCKALEMQVTAARELGCTEVVGKIAGVRGPYNGRYAFDRFRTDVEWCEQLYASRNLLLKIRPVLADLGVRIDLENHEDLTTWELCDLIEAVGPENLGISLDVANLPVLGENPYEGSKRLAPFTHLMHIKDLLLLSTPNGLLRQIRPAGEGVLEWEKIIPSLHSFDPNIRLLVEDHKGMIQIDLHEPAWRQHYPRLEEAEIESLIQLAVLSGRKISEGVFQAPELYEAIPYSQQKSQRLAQSLAYLQSMRAQYGLWDR